ncbi:MAG: SDR family NAD(P)-dependent oxidoreductase [Gammaproteobacteria bacterium]|nr:SDR family NAD(P)-dependent oxidoreductase [Gammaproteobacteria bacterium]
MKWTEQDIPDQTGRDAIVTGANSGIGYETARMLAHKGAHVVLACRSAEKGEAALSKIVAEKPKGQVSFASMDLSDLESVHDFAVQFSNSHQKLDLLINNAGVMVPPESKTAQGFELQFGVNHLGHFALTGHLSKLLVQTSGARVVNLSSLAHRTGKIDFDDLNFEKRGYAPWHAYGQSKLANLLFTQELQNRFTSGDFDVMATSAHPGWTKTDLQRTAWYVRALNPLMAMKPSQGALPTLRAATDPGLNGGEYFGPHRFQEMTGYPVAAFRTQAATSSRDAQRLWQVSEELTGVQFELS